MKLAIVGSRSFTDFQRMDRELESYKNRVTEIISGGARGADSLGEHWANLYGKKCNVIVPNWKQHGKKAGILRNLDIVESCDEVIAFWDGKSRGTQHTISEALKLGKQVKIIRYEN